MKLKYERKKAANQEDGTESKVLIRVTDSASPPETLSSVVSQGHTDCCGPALHLLLLLLALLIFISHY